MKEIKHVAVENREFEIRNVSVVLDSSTFSYHRNSDKGRNHCFGNQTVHETEGVVDLANNGENQSGCCRKRGVWLSR